MSASTPPSVGRVASRKSAISRCCAGRSRCAVRSPNRTDLPWRAQYRTPPAVIVDERDAPGAGALRQRADHPELHRFARSRYFCPAAMLVRWRGRKAHLLLDCDPQILHEMEPISNLTRLRCTLVSSLRIQPASVSAHDLDRRVPLQPSRGTGHAPVVKDVDDRTALQVDDNRAVAPGSPPAPIIYANNPNPGVAMSARGIPLQLPQDRVVADRHAEPPHQALAGTAAGVMTEQTDNPGDPPCPARIRGGNRRQPVGECLSFTFLMGAPPAAQRLNRSFTVTVLPWAGRS